MIEANGILTHTLLLAASEPDLPKISDLLPPPILFAGTPFAINRIILIRIVIVLIMMIVMGLTAMRAKIIPGRWQSLVEMGIDFIRKDIVFAVMGEKRGQRHVPMIATIFFTIFVMNFCSVLPGANIAATATVTMPLVFAVWVLIQYWVVAAQKRGLWSFLKDELFIPGVPWPIYILLSPIQLIELLIIRPVSLTIRLFANMVSGHLMVATFIAFTQFWFFEAGNKLIGVPLGVVWFLGAFMLSCLEAFVAFLQALVFSMLATAYMNLSYPEDE